MNPKINIKKETPNDCETPGIKDRFFKIIMPDDIDDGTLRIPPTFVHLHGSKLYDEVNVVVKNSAAVKVKIENPKGKELFLGKGFDLLSQKYNLQHGHWLLFKYEGGSQLKLRIFDKSCSEIKYPEQCQSSQVKDHGRNVPLEEKYNKNCFFTFIFADEEKDGKMRIPKAFAKMNEERLGKKMKIRIGNGPIWEVQLERESDGKYFLTNGWKEVATSYSLDFGNFMVFRLKENSRMDGIILDKTAMEIKYPLNLSGHVIQSQVQKRGRTTGKSSRKGKEKANQGEEKTEDTFTITLNNDLFGRFDQSIPKSTMTYTMIQSSKTWQINFEGYTWKVTILVNGDRRKFSKGWRSFVEDNKDKFRAGTVLNFKINDGPNPTMEVSMAH